MEESADVVIIGGGLGGVAAALALARHDRTVIMTEETDWLGGQLTSQAVPPDEHKWIEQFGCTQSYRNLRDRIRDHYRQRYPLSDRARQDPFLNPGDGVVSALCHEPRVAVSAIEEMLAPYVRSGTIRVLLNHVAISTDTDKDSVRAVTVRALDGSRRTLTAPLVIDATETGELLPLTKTEYVTGFEGQDETGEPHAPPRAEPLNMQAVSWCYALDHVEGEDHTIDKPADYAFWSSYKSPIWPGPHLGWITPDPRTAAPVEHVLRPNVDNEQPYNPDGVTEAHSRDLWRYRRIIARHNFVPGTYASDVTTVNWPMIDYIEGPVFEVDDATADEHLRGTRQLSLSLLHWMQTEAPRPDGGTGYPGLRLRGDITGTSDGLAKSPYIRESRRIRAQYTVVEDDVVGTSAHPWATSYPDTVGLGSYRIDLHPSTGGDGFIDLASNPFEIPLGALLPVRVRNLLPAAKNIGTTHITNGCFRLHPVEWNIGEAAGLLAAYCLEHRTEPHAVRATADQLSEFQALLTASGVELRWPDSLSL